MKQTTFSLRDSGSVHIYLGYLLSQGYDFKVRKASDFEFVVSTDPKADPPPASFLRRAETALVPVKEAL